MPRIESVTISNEWRDDGSLQSVVYPWQRKIRDPQRQKILKIMCSLKSPRPVEHESPKVRKERAVSPMLEVLRKLSIDNWLPLDAFSGTLTDRQHLGNVLQHALHLKFNLRTQRSGLGGILLAKKAKNKCSSDYY